jgi:hypothetical protein
LIIVVLEEEIVVGIFGRSLVAIFIVGVIIEAVPNDSEQSSYYDPPLARM